MIRHRREDLFYRLSVVPIRVPALRERPHDVRLLAEYFLDDFCARNNFKPKRMDETVFPLLESYLWPGNARELRNAVERMAILTPGERLTRDSVPVEIRMQRETGVKSTIQEARESAERERSCGRLRNPTGTSPAPRGHWGWKGLTCTSASARWA